MNEIIRKPRIKAKETLKTQERKTIKALIVTLTSMILFLSVVFLLTTNQSSQLGSSLQQEKTKYEQLKDLNTILKTKIINNISFSKLEKNEKIANMSEILEKTFVTETDNRVN